MGMFSKDDENYVYELVSKNITRIREMRGLTKKELAEKTFFNPHFIYNIENMNYYQTFSIPTLVLLARGLDVIFANSLWKMKSSKTKKQNN